MALLLRMLSIISCLKLLPANSFLSSNGSKITRNYPGLQVSLALNKTEQLHPSEIISAEFIIKSLNESSNVTNGLLQIYLPFPELMLIKAEEEIGNRRLSLLFNGTASKLDVILSLFQSKQRVFLLLQTSKSLLVQMKLKILYKIQYVLNGGLNIFLSPSIILYTTSLPNYVFQKISIKPDNVEAGDTINMSLVLEKKSKVLRAVKLLANIKMKNVDALSVNCGDGNRTSASAGNETVAIWSEELITESKVSCHIKGIIQNYLDLGGMLRFDSSLSYYHKKPQINLYPIEHVLPRYLNVSPVLISANSSSNLSLVLANENFNISLKFDIPRSVSLFNVTIYLPTYRPKVSSNGSTIHVLQPLINQNSNFPIKYNFNNAVLQQNATNFQLLNDSTLNVDFGLISTLGINKSIISPTLQMQLPFQVKNDPLNAFLMQSYIHIAVGHSSLKLPVQITGPAINPVLSLQKSVKILDANRDSPVFSFEIIVQNSNSSLADASNIQVVDYAENMVIFNGFVTPKGEFEQKSRDGYLIEIKAQIDRLKVSQNATITYTGAFIRGIKSSEFKWKAKVTWRSIQVNNVKDFTEYSQDVCLKAARESVVQYTKSYTMVLLGVVTGIIFGVLIGLLGAFCLRRVRVAKTYAFTDIMEENYDEEKKIPNVYLNDISQRKKPFAAGQIKLKQKMEFERLMNCNWPFMIAATYENTTIAKGRSRTLIHELIHGYDNSFKYFVISLSQAIEYFATSLKSDGDISAESLRSIQDGIKSTILNCSQESRVISNQVSMSSDDLEDIGKQYLEKQCSLVQIAKARCSKLLQGMFSSSIEERKIQKIENHFKDLEREVFMHSNDLRAQAYLHVKELQLCQNGFSNLLIWSKNLFYLWCQWMSKKILRELDILQRKRGISEEDASILTQNIEHLFKQRKGFYDEELHKKSVSLQQRLSLDFRQHSASSDEELQAQLTKINSQPTQGSSKSTSQDTLDFVQKLFAIFSNCVTSYGFEIEKQEKEMFTETIEMIKEATSSQLNLVTSNVRHLFIQFFSSTNYRCNGKDANTQTKSKISNEEMMKVMMECLEDIQADYNEAKQINDSMIHDFLEEMQAFREDVNQTALSILKETEKLIEEPMTQCRFQLKSLLYFLRNASFPRIKSILEIWSSFLHLTLTEVYLRNDLKHFAETKSLKEEDDRSQENVIYWFKTIASITKSEFEKMKKEFTDLVEPQKNELQRLFHDQTECLKNVAKDFVFKDLKEDNARIKEMTKLKQEFLIIHQFIAKLYSDMEDNRQNSVPEVNDCYMKFRKAIKSLTSEETGDETAAENSLKQDINQLTQYFKQDCESMQGQQDLGATGKIDYLLFDENGVIEKIKKMIYAKKREEEKIFILQELQNENLDLISNLLKMDKIPHPTFMMLIKVLYSNLSKGEFDETMTRIDDHAKRDYFAELSSYLVDEKISRKIQENEGKNSSQLVQRKKERKKSKSTKKNAIGPEP